MTEQRLDVGLGPRTYPIVCTKEGPTRALGAELERIAAMGDRRPSLMIVSDDNVAPLYASELITALEGRGFRTLTHVVEAGEQSKDWRVAQALVDHALDNRLTRQDLVIALGGGVVGDLAGFVASILHRGVRYIQVPTTLLAQVDSAVGGKTAINHPLGKNLVGTFWQPSAVISSQATLQTLDEREMRSGLAEAVKHGLIMDAALVDWMVSYDQAILQRDKAVLGALVLRCCALKASLVEADERDGSQRAALNFGHTLGHAYERLCGYGELSHGEAVALGMVWACRLSEALGVAERGLAGEVVETLRRLQLPWDVEDDALPGLAALLEAARYDKKSDGEHVRFVMIRKVGDFVIERMPWTMISKSLGR